MVAGHRDSAREPSLRDYAAAVWRRRAVVLVVTIIAPIVALAYGLHEQPKYQAGADVVLAQQNLAPALTGAAVALPQEDSDRFAVTQARLARTIPVAEQTLKAVGSTSLTPSEFLSISNVAASPDSDFLHFTVTAGSPAAAARLVTAYARQFAAYRQQLDTSALTRAKDDVSRKLTQLADSGAKTSRLYSTLLVQQQQLTTLEIVQTPRAIVADIATSAAKVSPRPVKLAVVTTAVGLLGGLLLAFLVEAFDTRIRSADALAEALGLPVLGRIPPPPRELRDQPLPLAVDRGSPYSEAFRMLRLNLELADPEQQAKVVVVTSALPGEGKSTIAANLALACARSGSRVLLVDLDLRKPRLDQLCEVPPRRGLTQVALGKIGLEHAVSPMKQRFVGPTLRAVDGARTEGKLDVLASGPLPPDPGAFVESAAVARLLANAKKAYDLVILDTPPMLDVGDALALAPRVDGMLIVARLNEAGTAQVRHLTHLLDSIPAPKLGVVLTGVAGISSYRYYGRAVEPAGTFLESPRRLVGKAGRPATAPTEE